jgi:hypothetical protein
MDFLLFVILILMLLGFAYAQWQKGVFRTPGQITSTEEEVEVNRQKVE